MVCNSNRRELARVRDRKFHVTQSSPYVRGEGTREEALKTTSTRREARTNMAENQLSSCWNMGSGTQSVLEDIFLNSLKRGCMQASKICRGLAACRPNQPAQADNPEKALTVGGVGPDGIFWHHHNTTKQHPSVLQSAQSICPCRDPFVFVFYCSFHGFLHAKLQTINNQ